MSTYYSPGCKNDKAHICDYCERNDGRPTLYWENKDFDLCESCLIQLVKIHVDPKLKLTETIEIKRQSIPEKLRNKIFMRDKNRCQYCGSIENLVIDHIIPFARGGTTNENNLQTLCRNCNLKKREL